MVTLTNPTALNFKINAPLVIQTARFGVGADNAANTGNFDTNLYTVSPPANGTYGNFTVASGVISCNGSQTVGTYSVGGYPVEVINGFKAIANQTQMNAVTPANSAGKTILIREAASLTITQTWNAGGDFNYATILGDGPDYRGAYLDVSKDSRKHFISFVTNNQKKLILDSLNFVTGSVAGAKVDAINFSNSGGGNFAADIYILRCRIICSRPALFGDYSTGHPSYPGSIGIFFADGRRCSVRDNVLYGGYGQEAVIALQGVSGWAECVGNHVDVFYGDAIRTPATRCLISSNLVSRPMAAGVDALDPHADVIQFIGGEAVVEGLGAIEGISRGSAFWQSFFASDATDYRLVVRDSVVSDSSLYSYTIIAAQGSTIENCVWLPKPGTTLPLVGTFGGMRYSHTSGLNELKNSVHRAGTSNVDVGITQSGMVDSTTWNSASYATNFPNWSYSGIPTLQTVLGTIGQGASAAAGKGPRIASMGAERSSIVYNLTAPTLSSLSLTPTPDGFTGTVASNQTRAPIFWCVVTNGSPAPTWRQIKERRATGAVEYGDGWVTGATLSLSTKALDPGTTYTVYAVQETGWSCQSNILSTSLTTTAANISRIAVGASATAIATTINIPVSTAINGDYLVAFLSHVTTTGNPTTPVGWTKIGTGPGFNTGSPAIAVYGRVRDGSEGANLTINTAGSGQLMGVMATYRSVSGDGAEAGSNIFTSGTMATPTLTAIANSCILHVWVANLGADTDVTLPVPGSLVALVENAGATWALGVENQLAVSAGTTSARTATSGNINTTWAAMQIELLD